MEDLAMLVFYLPIIILDAMFKAPTEAQPTGSSRPEHQDGGKP
jgi:hypothetical protein